MLVVIVDVVIVTRTVPALDERGRRCRREGRANSGWSVAFRVCMQSTSTPCRTRRVRRVVMKAPAFALKTLLLPFEILSSCRTTSPRFANLGLLQGSSGRGGITFIIRRGRRMGVATNARVTTNAGLEQRARGIEGDGL